MFVCLNIYAFEAIYIKVVLIVLEFDSMLIISIFLQNCFFIILYVGLLVYILVHENTRVGVCICVNIYLFLWVWLCLSFITSYASLFLWVCYFTFFLVQLSVRVFYAFVCAFVLMWILCYLCFICLFVFVYVCLYLFVSVCFMMCICT